ncbi:DUF3618 domain-containing protein [Actinoplanes subglobosus]|uniref:DUF3618 domain-containing protein n=1 Tax=Actinoplanes subglobosus TaxID=1547892 RepID=A0ABV8IPB4_9ACTN
MTSSDVPGQPEHLRDEIEQTRAELGDTVEALAAKTDVKARAKQALDGAADRTRQQLSTAKTTAVDAVDAAKVRVSEASQDPRVRRAVPPAAIAAAVATVVGTVIVVARRRRAAARRARLRPASWRSRLR